MTAPLAAILAGGASRRYGAPKALASVGGARIIDRVVGALGTLGAGPPPTPRIVLIANEPDLFADLGLPTRPDARPGLGVLGGILTALLWAREEGRPGVLAVACDMPFLQPTLLRRLLDEAGAANPTAAATGADAPAASAEGAPDVVTPESRGRRGVEPLCAHYGIGCIPAIEATLERGDRHVVAFYDDVRVRRIPLAEVRMFGDPDALFLNVNTPEDRERAERLARARPDAPPPRVAAHG